ncbi:hypothetical protein DCC62_20595 [candidate division KSB1 bacterium]|nr:MAG: hypothetical protein DCC62_20595 [candidate division KSB1 bacterium]
MIIFSDFDGTIVQNDVGNLLARTFGDAASCAEAVAAWKRDEISSWQCIERESATIRVTQFQLEAFCDRQMLSNGFVEFAALCSSRAWPLIVLSDGWDYYIQRILARHGLTLPVYSNHLRFAPPDRLYWRRLFRPLRRAGSEFDFCQRRAGGLAAERTNYASSVRRFCRDRGCFGGKTGQ